MRFNVKVTVRHGILPTYTFKTKSQYDFTVTAKTLSMARRPAVEAFNKARGQYQALSCSTTPEGHLVLIAATKRDLESEAKIRREKLRGMLGNRARASRFGPLRSER